MATSVSATNAQRELGLRDPGRALRLSRDLRNIPVDRYRLPRDGRKWKSIARKRMGLAEWLATHGDPDGSNIRPAVRSIIRHFGWSRGKTFYLLADLKELRLLNDHGLFRERGPRVRSMNVAAFAGEAQAAAEVQHSSRSPRFAEPKSNVTLDTTVLPTDQSKSQNLRPLTRPTPCGKVENQKPATPQQRRYAIIRSLAKKAAEILCSQPERSRSDLAEDLKEWAASQRIPYFDARPGASTPVQQAIDKAIEWGETA
jgi:hypothetical protein